MKKFSFKFNLLLALFCFGAVSFTFAHAVPKLRNQCNNNGKKYYAKAKANGPGCNKEMEKLWSCDSANTGFQPVFRYDNGGTPTCGCVNTATQFKGAEAKAVSSSQLQSEYTMKVSSCSGYRAGGLVLTSKNNALISSPYQGNVANFLSNSDLVFDYQNNAITLNALSGYLEIDSEDFENEYSTVLINISQILNPGDFETMVILYSVRFDFSHGKFTVFDDKNLFSASDFKTIKLPHGYRFELPINNKLISNSASNNQPMFQNMAQNQPQ